MNIFRQLTQKPWLEGQDEAIEIGGQAFDQSSAKIGLKVFLVVVMVVFSLFIVTYTERRLFSDWYAVAIPWLLWPNTVILILCSVAFEWTWTGARRGQRERVKKGLAISGVLTVAFLAGQLLAWLELIGTGYYAAVNPASAFFYLLTGAHAVHLIGGLVAWGRTVAKLRRGREAVQVSASIELCAIYWHFLLLLWLVIFALLLLS